MYKKACAAVLILVLAVSVPFVMKKTDVLTQQVSFACELSHYPSITELSIGKQTEIIRVADYGAVGDGITDDTTAFSKACDAFQAAGKDAALILENKTYYFEDTTTKKYAIQASRMKNSAIIGNGATILIGGQMKSLNITECENFYIKGLHFDRRQRSHFTGKILAIDYERHYMRVLADREVDLTGIYEYQNNEFAFSDRGNETSRYYLFLDKISVFNQKYNTYDVYVKPDGQIYTEENFKALSIGKKVIVPTPAIGHIGSATASVDENKNILLEDINVYNYADFCFSVSNNSGKVVFYNVNLCPPTDESVVFTGWRDGFHCKYNTASLIWENCRITGLGDDIINISANMMYVSEVINSHEIRCHWSLLDGESYGTVQPGSKVVLFDSATGRLIGKTTVLKTVDEEINHYILSDDLENLTAGENICFYVDSHAAPDSQIINCNFEGTLRFKGAGGTVRDSRLKMLALVLYAEKNIEGPIPHDITFSACDFTGSWYNSIRATANNPLAKWSEGNYRLENIRFEYCKGLTRDMFMNESNFDLESPDYLTISPEIGYELKGSKERNIRLGVSNGCQNGKMLANVVVTADFLCDGFSARLNYNSTKLRYVGNITGVSQDGSGLKLAAVGNVNDGKGKFIILKFETNGIAKGSDFILSDVIAIPHSKTYRVNAGYITRLHGDANADDKIDLIDLVRLKKILAGMSGSTDNGADCNSDDVVDALDVSLLRKYLLGVDGVFE